MALFLHFIATCGFGNLEEKEILPEVNAINDRTLQKIDEVFITCVDQHLLLDGNFRITFSGNQSAGIIRQSYKVNDSLLFNIYILIQKNQLIEICV